MRLELTARNTEITPTLRRLVERKLAKLERMLNDAAVSAQAVLTREKYRHRAEITLHARGEKFLHGLGNSESWETAVSDAVEKLSQQALRVKGKWQERKRRSRDQPLPIEQPVAAAVAPKAARVRARVPHTMRTVRQAVKAMSVSAAARELESAREGVVVFRDPETDGISVLYRRADGDMTLVETES